MRARPAAVFLVAVVTGGCRPEVRAVEHPRQTYVAGVEPELLWRKEWRGPKGFTVCPTAPLVALPSGSVLLAGESVGPIRLDDGWSNPPGAILLEVDANGRSTDTHFAGFSEHPGELVALSVQPRGIAALLRETAGHYVWTRRATLTSPPRRERIVSGVAWALVKYDYLVVAGEHGIGMEGPDVWGRALSDGSGQMPDSIRVIAFDGTSRLAVGGFGGEGRISVLDLTGTVRWHAELPGSIVEGVAFDEAGGLWVTGRFQGLMRIGGSLWQSPPPVVPGMDPNHVTDTFVAHYDRDGRQTVARHFSAGGSVMPSAPAVRGDHVFFLASLYGDPRAIDPKLPAADRANATLLMAVDSRGAVTLVERIGEATRSDVDSIVAWDDGLAAVLAHTNDDREQCEMLRFGWRQRVPAAAAP